MTDCPDRGRYAWRQEPTAETIVTSRFNEPRRPFPNRDGSSQMPLTSADPDAFADELYLGVSFAMLDEDQRVVCRVTKAALEDRAAMDRRPESVVQTFQRCRQEIETIASLRYDDGVREPVVRSADLVPIRMTA